jgi:hypothetical protein
MSDYLKEKKIKLINDGKFILIEKDGVETKYRISITSLSLKQCLIRNLMILLESKDRDFIKGVVDSWYKQFKTTKEPPTIQIEKKESVSMDFSVVLKAFDDFKEGLLKSKDMEIKQLKEEIEEDREAWGGWVGKEKEKADNMVEEHLWFIEKEKAWREERKEYENQVTDLLLEIEGLKERNEELEERVEDLVRDLEYRDNERINDF